MKYRITSYSALQANLSAANTAVMLCRANIGRLPLSSDERDETIGRVRKQIGDLEAMILELTRPETRKRCSPVIRSHSGRAVGIRHADADAGADW
jgi:hypothetical protein